ncbi:MAG TPA: radical SAM family heme chaperone HemW [Candidatus Solibacter sp.]|nr:radical SAM family heme chaperone HemW [Candidatus Solibacter sp.]
MSRLGIYVQVPFCQTKCTYCNFHTGVVSAGRFSPYAEAVCREIRGHWELYRDAGVHWGSGDRNAANFEHGPEVLSKQSAQRTQREEEFVVDTVYIGGGTPSLLEPELLLRMMETIRGTLATELSEVTLEADPETVGPEKAAAWVEAGINRVSFGVQSFSDKELAAAGRMHRRVDIYRAAAILREAGIRNISFDLIAGLPHQTVESWKESLEELRKLEPEHVSVYLLEVDEGSRLGKELLSGGARYSAGAVPNDDEMADFYESARDFLGAAGYHHYEISNWAKPGCESRHNLKYWRREAYLGFGAGAHSFSGRQRWANAHDAAEYVGAIVAGRLPVEQLEPVTRVSALEEELFLGLRQLDGIDVGKIEREYGVELEERFGPLETAGLIEREGGIVRLAPKRLSVSNEAFVELMR